MLQTDSGIMELRQGKPAQQSRVCLKSNGRNRNRKTSHRHVPSACRSSRTDRLRIRLKPTWQSEASVALHSFRGMPATSRLRRGADVKRRTTPRAVWCYVVDCTARSCVKPGAISHLNSPCYPVAITPQTRTGMPLRPSTVPLVGAGRDPNVSTP